jgi:hypothetical protein
MRQPAAGDSAGERCQSTQSNQSCRCLDSRVITLANDRGSVALDCGHATVANPHRPHNERQAQGALGEVCRSRAARRLATTIAATPSRYSASVGPSKHQRRAAAVRAMRCGRRPVTSADAERLQSASPIQQARRFWSRVCKAMSGQPVANAGRKRRW